MGGPSTRVCFVLGPCLSWGCSGFEVLLCRWLRSVLGSLRDCPVSLVSMLTFGTNHRPSSEIVRSRIHPSLPILPFRVPSHFHPPRTFERDRPAWISTLIASSPASSISAASTQLLLSSVPGFRNLSTVCSDTGSPGLFHPGATSRVHHRSRRSLSAQRPSLVERTTSVRVQSPSAHQLAPAATAAPAHFEVSFRAEQRSHSCVV